VETDSPDAAQVSIFISDAAGKEVLET